MVDILFQREEITRLSYKYDVKFKGYYDGFIYVYN